MKKQNIQSFILNAFIVLTPALLIIAPINKAAAEAQEPNLESSQAPTVNQAQKKYSANLSASLEAGKIENPDANLTSRTMTALSLSAVPLYKISDKFKIGLNTNFRFQQQQTKLADVDNTNLAGKLWQLGVAGVYELSQKFNIQAALNILGQNALDKMAQNGDSAKIENPLGLDLKAQYFWSDSSNFSADAIINYERFSKLSAGSQNISGPTTQWMMGVGITYHLGRDTASVAQTEPKAAPQSPPELLPSVQAELKPEENLQSETHKALTGFRPNQTKLDAKNAEVEKQITELVEMLKSNPKTKIEITGHADSSGNEKINIGLSRMRAEQVQAMLIKRGVKKNQITIKAAGSKEPIVDSNTAEAKAQNRRVETKVLKK